MSSCLAALAMTLAGAIERRLGPAAAGWVAALPVGFSVALAAVMVAAGGGPAAAMALSAAAHVPAQALFAVAFAGALTRRGLRAGAPAGALAYVAGSACLVATPDALAIAAALPALLLAARALPNGGRRATGPRSWRGIVLSGAAAAAFVGTAVVTSRLAGPEAAGTVAAFPSVSLTLAVAIAGRDGRRAGADALAGLVRSLPCYLAFCLVVVLAAPSLGLSAIGLGLLACAAAACVTWTASLRS